MSNHHMNVARLQRRHGSQNVTKHRSSTELVQNLRQS